MKTLFCILSHGRASLTVRCVRHLERFSFGKIHVLDNGSEAEEFLFLRDNLPKSAELMRSDVNLGITQGRIRMAEDAFSSGADMVIFLDNDQFPSTGAIEAYKQIGDGCILGAEAWSMNQAFRPVRKVDKHGEQFTYVGCGGMAVHKYIWNALGGFDSQFSPYYFEDPDFCLRFVESGGEMQVMRPHEMTHEAHSTLGVKRDRMSMFLSNYQRFHKKWVGKEHLLQRGLTRWV